MAEQKWSIKLFGRTEKKFK